MQDTIETRAGELMTISLSLLVPSKHNVRKTDGLDVSDLKASIEAQGVLQNLIVVPATAKRRGAVEKYEVVGGMRRLRALQQLAQEGRIDRDEPILCRVKPSQAAAEASLAENVVRLQMHPADEFEAFQALVQKGRKVEDIALSFGTSPLTVRRRLKLAGLHPALLALYRSDGIQLDQLMALAVSDDPDEQLRVWQRAVPWQRDAASLRRTIVREEIDAARDPLALLVGVEAYEAAGGRVRRDLFTDQGEGYLQDREVLRRLADERLAAAAEEVRAEGWSWVEVTERMTAFDLYAFGRCPAAQRAMNKAEAKRHKALSSELTTLQAKWEELEEADQDDEPGAERVKQQIEEVQAEIDALEQQLTCYSAEAMAAAGAVVCVARDGSIEVHRGLVRKAARRPASVEAEDGEVNDDAEGRVETKPTERSRHCAALMTELTGHCTLAARAALLDQPGVALVALLDCLVQRLLYEGHSPARTAVRLVPNAADAGLTGVAASGCRAAEVICEAKARWGERLPGDSDRLLPWLLALEEGDRQELLALCVALTVNDVRDTDRHGPLAQLAQALRLDMADWWEPTAAGYFGRVTKDVILEAIGEGAGPEAAARIKGVSKAELARVAERELQGKRWLPTPLRFDRHDASSD